MSIHQITNLVSYVVCHDSSNHPASGGYWTNLMLTLVHKPKSVKEALHGSDSKKWVVTMQEELDSLYPNEVGI